MIRLHRFLSCATLGGVLVAMALAAGGCHKTRGFIPTEKLLVTRVAVAPVLAEPQPAAVAVRTLTWGEAYRARARQPDFTWAGPFNGKREQRTGMIEVSRLPADPPRFAFEADFLEADVPTTDWLCAKMTLRSLSPSACAEQLLRTVATESTLVAYLPTWQADSPVAELVDGAVHQTTIPALSISAWSPSTSAPSCSRGATGSALGSGPGAPSWCCSSRLRSSAPARSRSPRPTPAIPPG